jgi:hypothetical protein
MGVWLGGVDFSSDDALHKLVLMSTITRKSVLFENKKVTTKVICMSERRKRTTKVDLES